MSEKNPFKKGFKYRSYLPYPKQGVLETHSSDPRTDKTSGPEEIFGHARHVWNLLLAEISEQYAKYKAKLTTHKPKVSFEVLSARLTELKKERPYLYNVSSVILQQKVKDLAMAFERFFKKLSKYPKFKTKHGRQSVRLVGDAFSIVDGKLLIAKWDQTIPISWSRDLPSKPSSVTISRETDNKDYVSFVCDHKPAKTSGVKEIGLDMGISSFYTDNNGNTISPPKYLIHLLERIVRVQRAVHRRKKGSKGYYKALKELQRLHAKAKHRRLDFLHKLSTRLIQENRLIVIENISLNWMSSNRFLAQKVYDLGWGMFARMLVYKSFESQHCSLITLERTFPSTQLCSKCGHRLTGDSKLKLQHRSWTCPECDTFHDRDINAAVNILNEGKRVKNPAPGLQIEDPDRLPFNV